jgi:hypothetical protein
VHKPTTKQWVIFAILIALAAVVARYLWKKGAERKT